MYGERKDPVLMVVKSVSWYSDWLWTGWLIPDEGKISIFSMASKLAVGLAQPPIGYQGQFSGSKTTGVCS
jgi:hypothetical protein